MNAQVIPMHTDRTATHTPGPWITDVRGCYIYADTGLDAPAIANLHSCETTSQQMKNAHLIAAAPELLAALKRCISQQIAERDRYYEGCSDSNGLVPDPEDQETLKLMDADIDGLRALVNKAESGTDDPFSQAHRPGGKPGIEP